MLLEAKDDLAAFAAFPEGHWKKIQPTNPLQRINREVKRRTDVAQVGHYHSDPRLPATTQGSGQHHHRSHTRATTMTLRHRLRALLIDAHQNPLQQAA
jgi:transposase-like protein